MHYNSSVKKTFRLIFTNFNENQNTKSTDKIPINRDKVSWVWQFPMHFVLSSKAKLYYFLFFFGYKFYICTHWYFWLVSSRDFRWNRHIRRENPIRLVTDRFLPFVCFFFREEIRFHFFTSHEIIEIKYWVNYMKLAAPCSLKPNSISIENAIQHLPQICLSFYA